MFLLYHGICKVNMKEEQDYWDESENNSDRKIKKR